MDVGLVCDSCSTFNPMGTTACSQCNTALSLDPAATGTPAGNPPKATSQHAAAAITCTVCMAPITPGHKFCGACGSPVDSDITTPETPAVSGASPPPPAPSQPSSAAPRKSGGKNVRKTMFFGAMQATRAKLVLIKGDGLDGVSFTLAGDEHIAGRVDAPLLFEEDPFLSPTHANFFYRNNQLIVRDEDSVNGVYTRIHGTHAIELGARFLVGEQLLEVTDTLTSDNQSPDDSGTYFFASPYKPSPFRIVQQLRGGDTGLAYRAQNNVVSLGREGNDINFPDDPFISGRHAQVTFEDGKLSLTDLGSKNGTFLRVEQEQELRHGDYVFMGQQLLRVEIV